MKQEIPSGEGARSSQADGEPPRAGEGRAGEETHDFAVGVTWSGDGAGRGSVTLSEKTLSVPICGARSLGGCGEGPNPEELLLAAIGACFVNTWAIFLAKLQLAYAQPALEVSGQLEKDPAGGWRMARARILAKVPSALYASEREKLDKTLALAERYCIVSKVARAAMPVEVAVEAV